jgi:hypothetical protein
MVSSDPKITNRIWFRLQLALGLFLAVLIGLNVGCRQSSTSPGAAPQTQAQNSPRPRAESTAIKTRIEIGFSTRQKFLDHYDKHGAEFGSISKEEYLRQAQELRDRPAGGDVLEIKRADEVITRFDRKTEAFLAFNRDLTIRTFFKPNDGERYFQRQSKRSVGRSGGNDNE